MTEPDPVEAACAIFCEESARMIARVVFAYWEGLGDQLPDDLRRELTTAFAEMWLGFNLPAAESEPEDLA